MAQIKACLFDLDGVLVDTATYHYQAWKRLANQLGFDFTEEQNEKLKGISRMESLDIVLGWGKLVKTEQEKLALATLKNTWYVEMINKMEASEILPGALQFLKSAKEDGLKLALGSASKNSSIILNRTGLLSYFDEIVDGNLVSKSKPDPEVFLKGAKLLGLNPEECVVFEDADAGVEAALAGNMKVVGIGNEGALKKANMVVANLGEITVKQVKSLK